MYLFIYILYSGDVGSSHYVLSDNIVGLNNNEEGTWKQSLVNKFVFLHFPFYDTHKSTGCSNYCAHAHLYNSYIDEGTTVIHTGDDKKL